MIYNGKRALIVLAAYDYESLAITLQSLTHTVDPQEKIVVVLNGKRGNLPSEKTERVARDWAAQNPATRFVVRPLCAGSSAYFALTEIIASYEPLKEVTQICKIDDDIIPLKKGWLAHLSKTYNELAQQRNMGFVTGLINNNCWGFAELIALYNKQEEYNHICNYTTVAGDYGERRVPAGKIDIGMGGTVWNYPYLAWWIHQWTSACVKDFISKTAAEAPKQIENDIHYSIGCIYFEKSLWLSMDPKKYNSTFDELLLHLHCKEGNKEKWVLMDEPMIHLFYRTQRQANSGLIKQVVPQLAELFNDQAFYSVEPVSPQDAIALMEESIADMKGRVTYLHKKVSGLSFVKKWKEKRKQKKLMAGV